MTPCRNYSVLAAPLCEDKARELEGMDPMRFQFYPSKWDKFGDSGTDRIELGGFTPVNFIRDCHVLFLADFNSNDVVLSQINALITLCESFIKSLTIALPYYPYGTNERVEKEGEVATASTVARLLSGLPSCGGGPVRVIVYDLHTLQNRFYFHGNAVASLCSTVPLLLTTLKEQARVGKPVEVIAFPDDGACKRFGKVFAEAGYPLVTCGKVRDGERRVVRIMEGTCKSQHVLIVDDLTRSGGTLHECGKVLLAAGACAVSAFVAHAAFPTGVAEKFLNNHGTTKQAGEFAIFERFYTTDSNPSVTNDLPENDIFHVLKLAPQLSRDLA